MGEEVGPLCYLGAALWTREKGGRWVGGLLVLVWTMGRGGRAGCLVWDLAGFVLLGSGRGLSLGRLEGWSGYGDGLGFLGRWVGRGRSGALCVVEAGIGRDGVGW